MLNSFSALSFAALTFTALAGVHTVNGQEELKSGVHRLDLAKLQVQEEAFHRKLLAEYLLEQEAEKLSVETSKQGANTLPKVAAKQAQRLDPVLPDIKNTAQVQTPQPVKLNALIPEVSATQTTLARVFAGIISSELGVSVKNYNEEARQRLALQDEEMQVILTMLMEV